jgi:hypothetical protein
VWARDGKAIFYKAVTRRGPSLSVFRVRVSEAHGSLQAGRPEKLFEGDYGSADVRDWDVAPDGRFLLDKPGSAEVRKNYFEQIYPDRIRVDLAGVPALLERVEKRN